MQTDNSAVYVVCCSLWAFEVLAKRLSKFCSRWSPQTIIFHKFRRCGLSADVIYSACNSGWVQFLESNSLTSANGSCCSQEYANNSHIALALVNIVYNQNKPFVLPCMDPFVFILVLYLRFYLPAQQLACFGRFGAWLWDSMQNYIKI